MKKTEKIVYVCESCGNETLYWQGKCSACGEWNSLKEFKVQKTLDRRKSGSQVSAKAVKLDQVTSGNTQRISTKISEMDRVLGGGVVPGSIILLGGDPGIGKSTLLLQVAKNLAQTNLEVLYISGEESPEQIKIRADRISKINGNLQLLCETDLDAIVEVIDKIKPGLIVVDSIQTMYDSFYPSTPGSIVQVRECALRFQKLAKTTNIPVILVGHMTKSGEVAGPRILEHMVDVVLYLEGERYHGNRILRGNKNRFGATDEIGVFDMEEGGLTEVKNPSEIFLKERLLGSPGSVVTCIIEGTRPFLVEIQALTNKTIFGYPRRTASGYDLNRMQLLVAVLQKHAGIALYDQDIYLNVVGGFKIKEPACDLAVLLAIASAFKNKKIEEKVCAFGEIGLSGEIRSVPHLTKRENEARRLGFSKIVKTQTLKNAIYQFIANGQHKN